MKLNPAYTAYMGSKKPSNPNALAVVSSMEDHMKLNEDLGTNIPLAESTDATIEMVQEPEISLEAGMSPDEMVDKLGAVLGKYEVPMGLMNKRKFFISLQQKLMQAMLRSIFCDTNLTVFCSFCYLF